MEICKEMIKLRKYLDEEGIKWKDASSRNRLWWICRTHFEMNGYRWSVVNGYGTYGGSGILDENNQGLLELMCDYVNDGEPVGWLKAYDVIDYIKQLKAGGKDNDD